MDAPQGTGDAGQADEPGVAVPVADQTGNIFALFAQKLFANGGEFFRNAGGSELLPGAALGGRGGLAPIQLPDSATVPARAQLGIVGRSDNVRRQSSVDGPQYQFSCVDRLTFRSVRRAAGGHYAGVFSSTTAWPVGPTPKFGLRREQFNAVMGDAVEASIETGRDPHMGSAIARNWRPISCEEWGATRPAEFRVPDDISWVLPQSYAQPRISHPDSMPDN